MNFPTNEVRKLFQDSQGYIWISTYNGLLRYDGYSIVVYKPDGVNHGRSIDSFVNMVAEDKENNLWIGTHNGLYVLHKETDEIEKIISPLLQVSNVESILYASNGDLWVGSNKGLFRRKAGSRTFDCEKNMDIKSVVEDGKVKYGLVLGNRGCCVIVLKRNCIILTTGLTLVIRRMSYFRMKPGIFGSVPGGMDW